MPQKLRQLVESSPEGMFFGKLAAKPLTGVSPSPLRSSGTFAAANGGFAAHLMGSSGGGGGRLCFSFRSSAFR